MIEFEHKWNKSFKPLIAGFILALGLTLFSYFITTRGWLHGEKLALSLMGLALVQALVQLIWFLHLGVESKPRWKLMLFLFMVMVLVILVGGSLWIMHNLNYNMML